MSQNKQKNFTKQAPAALLAIMQHAVDHGLSAPWAIDVSPGDQAIRLRLMGREHAAWVQTLVVVDEHNEKHDRPGWLRTSWVVQLPDTGVRFDIVTYREQPLAVLTVVPA